MERVGELVPPGGEGGLGATTICPTDWINPLISGLAGVSGAAVGAGAAIYVGRENQRAHAHAELAGAFGAYLASVETLVREFRRRPWQSVTRLKKLRQGGVLSRAIYRRLFWRDVEFLRRVQGDRVDRVWDQYWHANANLRVHAEPALLELVDETDGMIRRWQEDRPETTEWPPLRERMLSVYRGQLGARA